MSKELDAGMLRKSKYPPDFIPAGAETFIGIDIGCPGGETIVKGFYDGKTGEYHIQEVVHNA